MAPREEERKVSFEEDAQAIESSEDFVSEQAKKGNNGEDSESPFGDDMPETPEDKAASDDSQEESDEESKRTVITPKRPPGRPRKEDQRLVISVESNKEKKPPLSQEEEDRLHIKKVGSKELDELISRFDYSKAGTSYIGLHRVEPRTYKGRKIAGYLGRCEEKIDYEWIKNMHGGGTFDIFIHVFKNDMWRVAARRRIEISGDPNMENLTGHDKDEDKQERSKDLIEKTLIMSEKNTDRYQREAEQARKEKDDIMSKLITLTQNSNKGDDGKAHLGLVKEFMDSTLHLTREQLERAKENERLANERFLEAQKQYREELRALKQEMNEKTTRELNPLLAMLQADRKESGDKFAMMMQESMNRQENMMKILAENNKVQQENRDKMFEMQIRLMSESTKFKDDIAQKRMEEILTDLREAKKANNTDITSEIKKFRMLKELLGGETTPETEKESIVDKIFNNLDQAPGIISALGSLFSKGQPVVVQPPMATPALPPGQMQGSPEEEESEEPQEAPTPDPASEQKRAQMKIQLAMGKFMKESEEAVAEGADPIEFANTKVFGKYDDGILQQISSVPIKIIIAGLEQQINQIGGDSILLTAGGQDFLTKVHKAIHTKYNP